MATQPIEKLIDYSSIEFAKFDKIEINGKKSGSFLIGNIGEGDKKRSYVFKKRRIDGEQEDCESAAHNPEYRALQALGNILPLNNANSSVDHYRDIIVGYDVVKLSQMVEGRRVNGEYLILEPIKGGKPIDQAHTTIAEKIVDFYLIAKALQYMHKYNWIHLDANPKNMITSYNTTKLIDFESANDIAVAEKSDVLWTTIDYFAPEGLLLHQVGKFTDIYSLGASIVDTLTESERIIDEKGLIQETSSKLHLPRTKTKKERLNKIYGQFVEGRVALNSFGVLDPTDVVSMPCGGLSHEISCGRLSPAVAFKKLVMSMLERMHENRPTMDDIVKVYEGIVNSDRGLVDILMRKTSPCRVH